MEEKEFANGFRGGSALILAVVLTSLLAVIGTIFIMTARVDRMSTSAISENKDLNAAVEAVIAKISNKLAMDVPGRPEGDEYYDYPGDKDRWLASLEPYKDGNDYEWSQISDVTGYLQSMGTENVPIDSNAVLGDKEYRKIALDNNGNIAAPDGQLADADGDGVADSKWIELDDMTSSKGERIYAAVRVIDNGGMLNVNTAYMFDSNNPGADGEYIDGTDQMQINLFELSKRNSDSDNADLDSLNDERFGSETQDQENYLRDVVWRYNEPNGNYTPFDISDELELRNRFTLNRIDIGSRIENVWASAFKSGDGNYLWVPVGSYTPHKLPQWTKEVYYDYDSNEPNDVNDYSYRHIGTVYNMDRIINPAGGKMLNINATVDANTTINMIYRAIKAGLPDSSPTFPDAEETAAQIAVNLVDFRDPDSEVSFIEVNDVNGIPSTYYGFETPCIYISELAHKFVLLDIIGPMTFLIRKSYAIELYKPYKEDVYPDPNQRWRLNIDPYGIVDIDWSGSEGFHVVLFEADDVNLGADIDFNDLDPNLPGVPQQIGLPPSATVFEASKEIRLERWVEDANQWIAVDSVIVPGPVGDFLPDPTVYDGITHSVQKDITLHKCTRPFWSPGESIPVTLGRWNSYEQPLDPYYAKDIQAHPENRDFRNVGEIGKLFRKDVYETGSMSWTWTVVTMERDVRLNLADPNYHNLFQYLTVMDPTDDNIDNDGDDVEDEPYDPLALVPGDEIKVPGRINVNTAPWFVIRQLPWMRAEIAQAIVAYRDKLSIDPNGLDYSDREVATGIDVREEKGFASIGELATVVNSSPGYGAYSMRYYSLSSVGQGVDLDDYPDLTPSDGAPDDFEEQDVIFARISDLVTVRSDVFTAYILVRVGADGPQKRAMAILDRSNVYPSGGRVKVIAVQPASDPR